VQVFVDGKTGAALEPVVPDQLPAGAVENGNLRRSTSQARSRGNLMRQLQAIDVTPQLQDFSKSRMSLNLGGSGLHKA
jgi:hypothetical protein